MKDDREAKYEDFLRLARGNEANREYLQKNKSCPSFTEVRENIYERTIRAQELLLAKLVDR